MPLTEEQLQAIEKEHEHRVQPDTPTWPLFHYTRAETFEKIISNREIWATDYRYLNDRKEIIIGEDRAQTTLNEMAEAETGRRRAFISFIARLYESQRLTRTG